jgi:transcriptional regulator with XRE-family HTH domain
MVLEFAQQGGNISIMKARELVNWNVRRLRLKRGQTQEALADKTKIDRARISKIESGKVNPTCNALDLLAGALNTNVAELFRSKRPGARPPKPLKKGLK